MLQPVEIYSESMQVWRVNSAFGSACKLVLKTQWRMMRLERKIATRALNQQSLARQQMLESNIKVLIFAMANPKARKSFKFMAAKQ